MGLAPSLVQRTGRERRSGPSIRCGLFSHVFVGGTKIRSSVAWKFFGVWCRLAAELSAVRSSGGGGTVCACGTVVAVAKFGLQ